jgi:hypothetical protein
LLGNGTVNTLLHHQTSRPLLGNKYKHTKRGAVGGCAFYAVQSEAIQATYLSHELVASQLPSTEEVSAKAITGENTEDFYVCCSTVIYRVLRSANPL